MLSVTTRYGVLFSQLSIYMKIRHVVVMEMPFPKEHIPEYLYTIETVSIEGQRQDPRPKLEGTYRQVDQSLMKSQNPRF
jgi:hypothetical protein